MAAHEMSQAAKTSHAENTLEKPLRPRARYHGHAWDFGLAREEIERSFLIWFFGSGRYAPYLAQLTIGPAELSALAGALRDPNAFAKRVFGVLGENLQAELMRWHASKSLAQQARRLGVIPEPAIASRVASEIALTHRCFGWPDLLEKTKDGLYRGAISSDWILQTLDDAVLARALVALDAR
jgi:hypothetical protein